jgi:hypothetical protein
MVLKKARIFWGENIMKTVSDLFFRNIVTLIFPDSPRPKLSASSCNTLTCLPTILQLQLLFCFVGMYKNKVPRNKPEFIHLCRTC